MKQTQEILNLARQNNGIVTAAMVHTAGLSRGSLKYLSDTGSLIKTARGVYTLPEAWEDEFINLQSRYKRGIFSLGTALFLSDLTDRTPAKFHMTFPRSYNLSGPKQDGVLCSSCREPYYSMGITEMTTPGGHKVLAYCAERTLCDILRPRNHVDIQIIADAFKRYVSQKDRNIPLLSEYSKIFGVEKQVRAYLEILL